MKPSIRLVISLLVALPLAACAINDVPQPTPLAPITIEPPPDVSLAGTCTNTPELEAWLQTSALILADFRTRLDDAALKQPAELNQDIQALLVLRDNVFSIPAPDCAVEAHTALTTAVSQGVELFTGYYNGAAGDIARAVAEIKTELDRVAALQQDLIVRLEQQYQSTPISGS